MVTYPFIALIDSPCIKQTVCKILNLFQCGKYLVACVLNVAPTVHVLALFIKVRPDYELKPGQVLNSIDFGREGSVYSDFYYLQM